MIYAIAEAGYAVPFDSEPTADGLMVIYTEELGGLGLPTYPVEPGVLRARAATPEERTLTLPLLRQLLPDKPVRLYRVHRCPNASPARPRRRSAR